MYIYSWHQFALKISTSVQFEYSIFDDAFYNEEIFNFNVVIAETPVVLLTQLSYISQPLL